MDSRKELLKQFKNPVLCFILILLGYASGIRLFFIGAIIYGGSKQTLAGIRDTLDHHRLNVELLMILSAIGACIIAHESEGAILIFIFALSGALEDQTLNHSRSEIASLMTLQPATANMMDTDGSIREVDVRDLIIGSRLVIAKGEIVPIDGTIINGHSALDEAAITGESIPVTKGIGAAVFGGSMNNAAPLTIEVTSLFGDTLIQKIVRMVNEAQSFPSRTAQSIKRLEDVYARIVLILVALVTIIPYFLFHQPFQPVFYRAMILLVVASPCALIASVTPATLAAITNSARHGILVKGGIHLENLEHARVFCFDKTGTITQGTPTITDYAISEPKEPILAALAAIESFSAHPLANALVQGLTDQIRSDLDTTATDIQETSGFGISGTYSGKHYRIGKLDFMDAGDALIETTGKAYLNEGKSVLYIQSDQELVGVIALQDEVRPEAKALIRWLNDQDMETVLITGDNEETAKHIGGQVEMKHIKAKYLPDEKAAYLEELTERYGSVIMIGDGINDAPALAGATVGIAMGGGTDLAMEAADMVLVKDDLAKIKYVCRLSKRLRRIVSENIIFSFAVILILIALNGFSSLSLPLGVVGHEGSTILVILNSLRLLKKLS